MKRHPTIGRKIVAPIKTSKAVLDIISQHHEKIDGSGYPLGLKGDELSLFVKIVGVADAFDAMTTDRPYRDKQTKDYAISELLKNKGIQFDSEVVEHFVKVMKNINLEKK